ncbi:MAG: hypothetical protein JNL57_02455 [Bacteroidetes bacterium]|nr:hypothetical protein [Bacteroidota bacterium]
MKNSISILLCLGILQSSLKAQLPFSRPLMSNDLTYRPVRNQTGVTGTFSPGNFGISHFYQGRIQGANHIATEIGTFSNGDTLDLKHYRWEQWFAGAGMGSEVRFQYIHLQIQSGIGYQNIYHKHYDTGRQIQRMKQDHLYGWLQGSISYSKPRFQAGICVRVSGYYSIARQGTTQEFSENPEKFRTGVLLMSKYPTAEPAIFVNKTLSRDRGTSIGMQITGREFMQDNGIQWPSQFSANVSVRYGF